MAICNFDKKEINCKVFYFGMRQAGKTENLRSLYTKTSPEIKSQLFELEKKPSPIFDFLPLNLGEINGYQVRLHIFTLPPEHYRSAFDVMLKGLDGLVFVIDSDVYTLVSNIDAMRTTFYLLESAGYIVEDLPQVYQYNKRDTSDPVSLEILRDTFNPHGHPDHEAIAHRSIGTMECLRKLANLVVGKMLGS